MAAPFRQPILVSAAKHLWVWGHNRIGISGDHGKPGSAAAGASECVFAEPIHPNDEWPALHYRLRSTAYLCGGFTGLDHVRGRLRNPAVHGSWKCRQRHRNSKCGVQLRTHPEGHHRTNLPIRCLPLPRWPTGAWRPRCTSFLREEDHRPSGTAACGRTGDHHISGGDRRLDAKDLWIRKRSADIRIFTKWRRAELYAWSEWGCRNLQRVGNRSSYWGLEQATDTSLERERQFRLCQKPPNRVIRRSDRASL